MANYHLKSNQDFCYHSPYLTWVLFVARLKCNRYLWHMLCYGSIKVIIALCLINPKCFLYTLWKLHAILVCLSSLFCFGLINPIPSLEHFFNPPFKCKLHWNFINYGIFSKFKWIMDFSPLILLIVSSLMIYYFI